jgi:hypothetical protein
MYPEKPRGHEAVSSGLRRARLCLVNALLRRWWIGLDGEPGAGGGLGVFHRQFAVIFDLIRTRAIGSYKLSPYCKMTVGFGA